MKCRISIYKTKSIPNGITIIADDIKKGKFFSDCGYRIYGGKLLGNEPLLYKDVILDIPKENLLKD